MSKVQATVEGALKDSNNPHFKSKYADLSSVWAACRDQITAHGLSVVQFPGEMVDNRMTMTTQLSRTRAASGCGARSSIPLSKVDAQGYGSAVPTARRYALAAVVGVCPEDDDGNAASRPSIAASSSRLTASATTSATF
ncbi:ERF family protein [Sphingomonas sp. MMS24-JH45]